MTRPARSLEYIECTVTLTVGGVQVDPTDLEVKFAFPPSGTQPAPEDFQAGSWQSPTKPYKAEILVGPGGTFALPAGRYTGWIQVADAPELVRRPFDEITLT